LFNLLIVRAQKSEAAEPEELKIDETAVTDLPGALPSDSMRHGEELTSPTVDDSAVIGEEKYGQLYFIHSAVQKC